MLGLKCRYIFMPCKKRMVDVWMYVCVCVDEYIGGEIYYIYVCVGLMLYRIQYVHIMGKRENVPSNKSNSWDRCMRPSKRSSKLVLILSPPPTHSLFMGEEEEHLEREEDAFLRCMLGVGRKRERMMWDEREIYREIRQGLMLGNQ